MKQSSFKLLAVFFLSIALLAYEIAVMRTFSVGSWSNFGSLVISIALLGFGLAGTLLTYFQRWIKEKPNKWLCISALVLMPAMAVAHVLAQLVPFNPVMIVADASQVLLIGAYYLIYSIKKTIKIKNLIRKGQINRSTNKPIILKKQVNFK